MIAIAIITVTITNLYFYVIFITNPNKIIIKFYIHRKREI